MPRNGSGQYSLPTGNPVVSGTTIESSWANTTLSDLASEMTNSLSRTGAGGMTGAFRAANGTSTVPGIAWADETGTGFYRAGTSDTRFVVQTAEVQKWTASGTNVTGTFASTGAATVPALTATGNVSFDGGTFVFNDSGADKDARFEGNTDANLLFLDASADAVGIGTSSPQTSLDVRRASGIGIQFLESSSGNSTRVQLGTASGIGYINADAGVGTIALGLRVGGAQLVLLDSSGNLGLGVTPSAQGVYRTMQFGDFLNIGQQTTGTSQAFFGWNVRGSSTANQYLYNRTGDKAALYEIGSDAAHRWYTTSTNGTAGNAISFTQAMTLDASGNLGVGTTSPVTKLHVNSAAIDEVARFEGTGNPYISVYDSGTRQLYFGSVGASDVDLWVETNKNLRFATNNTERARITSGGDLLVGTTTLSDVGNSIFGSSVPGVIHQNNNAASNGFVFTSYRRSSVEIGSVSQNGTTAVLFNTTSDRRLKDNIVSAPSASDDIDAIQIVSHDWKSAPDEHVKYGVIAQDLHAVAPQAVLQGDDGDEIEKTWGVDYSKLVPMLIKEIQSLRARVAALEA